MSKYDKICVFLDEAHTKLQSGKRSPLFEDGKTRLFEWEYSREIINRVKEELDKLGIKYWTSHPEDDRLGKTDSEDLVVRTKRINAKYDELKKQGIKSFLISIHLNAAGNGGWYDATGWSVWTTKGKTISDELGVCMSLAAHEVLDPLKKKIRKDMSDGDEDFESNFWIIKLSKCASILTENFFLDNKNDVKWLMSEEGKKAITDIHVNGILKYIDLIS